MAVVRYRLGGGMACLENGADSTGFLSISCYFLGTGLNTHTHTHTLFFPYGKKLDLHLSSQKYILDGLKC